MNEEFIKIEEIRDCIAKRKISWTKHCLNRMNQRNIRTMDVKKAIKDGKIIEYYNQDYPYPSCLISGKTFNNKILHIVCGIYDSEVYMITTYYPDMDKWENGTKNRREKE